MANFPIYNDKAWTSPKLGFVTNGTSAANPPAGSTPAVVSASPNSLAATLNTGNPALGGGYTVTLTPKVVASTGIAVTISGTGLVPVTMLVDIVADPNALPIITIDQNPSDWTTVSQEIPTAPGP